MRTLGNERATMIWTFIIFMLLKSTKITYILLMSLVLFFGVGFILPR